MRLTTGIAILSLAPVFVALTGCDAILNGDWNAYTEDFHYSYPLAANGRVEVENLNGPIEITGWDQPTMDISGTKFAPDAEHLKEIKVDISASPSSVLVRTIPNSGWHSGGVHYILRVPRKAQIKRISDSNGPVRLDDLEAGAMVRTTNGPVHANHVRGDWQIETSNGPVVVEGLTGTVGIRTSNGPVQLTMDAAGEVRAQTSNGPITVHYPFGAGGEVRASTSNGPIHSEFPLSGGIDSRHHVEGSFGGGGPLIDLTTTNGPIRIVKL